MKKHLVIIIFLISIKSFACECAIKKLSEWQESELANSECIFIGEVIEVNDTDLTFKIKVTESLDGGDATGNIYVGKNWRYCNPYVENNGKWIVYGHMEEGFLRLNMCGISRSFDYPFVNLIPPSPDLYENKMTAKERKEIIEKLRAENTNKALSDLEMEITALRKRRDEK